MKLNKFTVILAILLISILAIGAVSAESVDDSDALAIDEDVGGVQESIEPIDIAEDLSAAEPADDLSVDDTPDELSVADAADDIVEDTGSAVLGDEPKSYDLDDDSYSTYFNEDGTATAKINESSDYTLNVGTLTNKDIKINYGSNINIVGKEGAGFIYNGTIYLDGGADGLVGSVTLSGLTFTNTNKNCIDIAQYCTDINIRENIINLVGDASFYPDNPYFTVTAIAPHDFVYGLNIIDNQVTVTGDAPYSNGIYVMNYLSAASPSNFNISGNTFDLNVSTYNGSAAAIFVECSDSVIENNNISIVTAEDLTYAYGIQIPDMASNNYYDKTYEGTATSFNNVAIKNNKIDIITKYMAYGISLYNYGTNGFDEDGADYGMYYPNFSAFELNVLISDNEVYIKSDKGVYGIVAQIYNMTVENNNLTIIGGSAEGIDSPDLLGEGTIALSIQYNGANPEEDFYVDVKNNIVRTNVTAEWTSNVLYVTLVNNILNIQDGVGRFIVTDETFDIFFDENGNPKDILTAGSTILLNDLSNKKLNINIPLNIEPYEGYEYFVTDPTLYNCAINLLEGADNTNITGLKMKNDGANADYSAIIKVAPLENITIAYNKIDAYNFVGNIYGIEAGMSNGIGCKDLTIDSNEISVVGSRYVYGIDIWGYGGNHTGVVIEDNKIYAYGADKMAEAIYLNYIDEFWIDNNTFFATTDTASAYGMGADNIFNGDIGHNEIISRSNAMAYGITLTQSDNVTIGNNSIHTDGEGTIAIGLAYTNDVNVYNETIYAAGGNYLAVASGDYLIGKGNEAICDKTDNVNLTIGENNITTRFPVFIDNDNYATYFNENGTLKEDIDISYISLNDLVGKDIVVDRDLTITGSAVNTTILVLPEGSGTAIKNLNMKATVSSGSCALIHTKGADSVTIADCTLEIVCNNDLSTYDMIMPIQVEGSATGCEIINIRGNHISVSGSAPYVYGIDAYKQWNSANYISNVYISNNIINLDVDSKMAEGIYASGLTESQMFNNTIDVRSTDSAYGIGTDSLFDVVISRNTINLNADGMAYGITATVAGKDLNIRNNKIDATGTGAMGIGFAGQNSITIDSNEVAIEGGDYTTLESKDSLGVGNAAIFDGGDNSNVNITGNRVDEYTSVNLEAADLTIAAATSGQGTYEVTVKTIDGQALANKEITFSFNNQVIKATTDANGIAKLSFDLNKAGKYPVSIAFLGDKQYKGAFATATITINPIKTSLTSAAKTYLATAKTKSLTATLKDANGKVLANKKVTFTVNGKTVTATTNAKGVATAKLALTAAKTYTVTIKFAGDGVYAASTVSAKVKLNKEKTKVTAPKKTFKKAKKVKKVVVTLKNSKGKAIAKKKVTLTVNKKKYTAKTNKKGKATFKIKNLKKKGTKKYTVKFAGDTQYKACKKTGKIKIK